MNGSMLHVAIGALCGTTGGPATYARFLIDELSRQPGLRLTVVTDRPEFFAGRDLPIETLPMSGGVDRLRWQHWALPRALQRIAPDLYHDTKNALPHRCPCPAVVTVHDLAYYRCPETFGVLSRTFLRRSTAAAVSAARRVVVPSQATADDVASIFPAAAQKTRVVWHGIAPHRRTSAAQQDDVLARYRLQRPFLLHAGTIQARKNVDLLVVAARRLRAQGAPWRVVLVGRRGWLSQAALHEIRADDTASWLGEVPAEDMAALYDCADAFVSPSAYEGFGFTVADALAAGLPCVVSNVSSLPEVCGDAAIKIEDLTVEGLIAALTRLWHEPGLATQLRTAGPARAQMFSWRRCAEQTAAVYQQAVESSS